MILLYLEVSKKKSDDKKKIKIKNYRKVGDEKVKQWIGGKK